MFDGTGDRNDQRWVRNFGYSGYSWQLQGLGIKDLDEAWTNSYLLRHPTGLVLLYYTHGKIEHCGIHILIDTYCNNIKNDAISKAALTLKILTRVFS